MHKKLKLLEQLQEIDLKIDGRKAEREGVLSQIAELDAQLEAGRAAVAERTAELEAVTAEKAALDENLAAETENIERSETRLHDIKTQKEYQAVQKEITAAKKLKSEIEEQVLVKIALIDELQGAVAEMEQNLAALEGNNASRRGELEEQVRAVDASMEGDAASRAELAGALSQPLINRYDQLRLRRQGVAVVEAKNGNCLGCNMNIPPQLYNNLYKGNEIITCPHCQRVLYMRREENGQ